MDDTLNWHLKLHPSKKALPMKLFNAMVSEEDSRRADKVDRDPGGSLPRTGKVPLALDLPCLPDAG